MAEIKVYSTDMCPWCVKLESFLKEKKIKFKKFDVAKDAGARKEMMEKSGQAGVPVIDINGKVIVGFDKAAIEGALEGE